jgi:cyclic beta-1,2-glucan synthetase
LVLWLNQSPIAPPPELAARDAWLVQKSALHIWRYFAEFSTEEHNWLIPDFVQDEPRKAAASVSPTNIGLLLNARQVAAEFGYLTLPEMVELTEKTLTSLTRMKKYRGHLMNWYDTTTLEAKTPLFISSVDNGNLIASLWTLRQGFRERLRQPLLPRSLAQGLLDYLRVLVEASAFPKKALRQCEEQFRRGDWLAAILTFAEKLVRQDQMRDRSRSSDVQWFRNQARLRVRSIYDLAKTYMPWTLPEFAELGEALTEVSSTESVTVAQLPGLIRALEGRLEVIQSNPNGKHATAERLQSMLREARQHALDLIVAMRQIGQQADELADLMDFKCLFDNQRMLMSVGLDAQSKELQPYYYDLLATEPRTAIFVAVAKDDIPQASWFQLGRPFSNDHGRRVLLSWTGTMFEYLMPAIWMQRYPNTLLDRALVSAVRSQQAYALDKNVPWGISESACAKRNEVGDYHYEAFGVPALALKRNELETVIISPYSTFLALSVDRNAALSNLRRMESMGWFGPYGFYEAADYSHTRRRFMGPRYEVVRQWMVHHQGMSLLSLANFLRDNVVQRWFHADPRVQATALLLQEKPASKAA